MAERHRERTEVVQRCNGRDAKRERQRAVRSPEHALGCYARQNELLQGIDLRLIDAKIAEVARVAEVQHLAVPVFERDHQQVVELR